MQQQKSTCKLNRIERAVRRCWGHFWRDACEMSRWSLVADRAVRAAMGLQRFSRSSEAIREWSAICDRFIAAPKTDDLGAILEGKVVNIFVSQLARFYSAWGFIPCSILTWFLTPHKIGGFHHAPACNVHKASLEDEYIYTFLVFHSCPRKDKFVTVLGIKEWLSRMIG